ncbi:MAG: RNA-binding protein [Desulfarculus sp.]|nr:MAG: RNA-binding protein [Desulfarculus sp.]
MAQNLFVGNLPYTTTDEELRALFEAHGSVHSAKVISDRVTGRSRGFGFVEMDPEGAAAAMAALNGKDLGGRPLRVDEANERKRD